MTDDPPGADIAPTLLLDPDVLERPYDFYDRLRREAPVWRVPGTDIVTVASFQARPELSLLPGFMVEAVAVVPRGAWPGSCWPLYEVDYPAVEQYMDVEGSLEAHIARGPEVAHG